MKQCKKCNQLKSLSEFYKRSSNKDGLRNWCKLCENESAKKWRNNNRSHIKDYNKKYKNENKEQIAKYLDDNKEVIAKKRKQRSPLMKEYFKKRYERIKSDPVYQKNKKKYREKFKKNNPDYFKEYYKENEAKIKNSVAKRYQEKSDEIKKYSREYGKKNKHKINKRNKERWKNDVEYRIKAGLRSHFNQSIIGNYKTGSVVEMLGMTIPKFKIYLEGKFEDWMNWNNRGLYNGKFNYGWDIDHIRPLSSFDFSNPEEINKAWHYSNLQPLCSKINREIKRDIY